MNRSKISKTKSRVKNTDTDSDLDQIQEKIKGSRIRLGVVGSRDCTDYQLIKKEIDYFNSRLPIDLIVSGGARGVDSLAERWADENNVKKLIFYPDLSKGKRGYAIRNQQIVDSSSHIIAFPSKKGKGTQITIGMARRKENVKLKVIDLD